MRQIEHWAKGVGGFAVAMALLAGGCGGQNLGPGAGGDGAASWADAGIPTDLGAPHGTIDPAGGGGTVNLLAFTAFGDVRPPLPDDDLQYPTKIVGAIMQGMDSLHPELAIGSGDYMFSILFPWSVDNQLKALLGAAANFHEPIFFAMGNHECNSTAQSNCPNLNETPNISKFMSMLLPWTPVPWFSFVVHTALGDAKLVVVAANAWTPAQAAWLDATLSVPSRYTFIVRHEAPIGVCATKDGPDGVMASDAIIAAHQPVTLYLYGHVHDYCHAAPNIALAGNGGAPLDQGNYGYLYVLQRPDGDVSVTEYQYDTGSPIDTWAVTPDGQAVP